LTPRLRRSALALFLLLLPGSVIAHSLGESYGVIRAGQADGDFTVTYNMRRDQFLQLADLRYFSGQTPLEIVSTEVRERYQLRVRDTPCENSRFAAVETEGFLSASFALRCPPGAAPTLVNDAFFDLLPDHLHFVRVSNAEGGFLAERVLDRATRLWALPEAGTFSLAEVAWRYARLGVGHMTFGFDHLAFLASILLLVGGVKPLILAITGFTVGHSITLALAVLGLAIPDGQLVEALIGLTIALVAAESVFRRQSRLGRYAAVILASGAALCVFSLLGRGPDPLTMAGITLFFAAYLLLTRQRPAWTSALTPLLTVFFGLIHGFGFAGSLLEIGLPLDRLAVALLVFNLGIEFGQLLTVGALLLSLLLLRRLIPAISAMELAARNALAGALVAVGIFWFVGRGFV
jgi:hypothetical protein